MIEQTKRGNPFALVLLDASMPEMNGFELAERIWNDPKLSGPPILMLSSTDLIETPYQELKARLYAYLVKPVSRPALLTVMLGALTTVHESDGALPARITSPAGPSLRVLVVEDNAINQRVIKALLERDRHSVSLARNGAEAVELFSTQPFDLIFMDVQMPVMNGYDATREIRRQEQRDGGHIPIIALTAHAMKGDRVICLTAGMDDYISKPINQTELKSALQRFGTALAVEALS
jgi:CheY-like chemotaxis protein